jgi:carbon-monoxide dehydrogenase large subunit
MNPLLLKGQMHGGVVQGLGQVFNEEIVYDEAGQLVTGSFMDYGLPRADELPYLEVISNPDPTPTHPLGVKGAGEAGTVGALACAMAAVRDALVQAGVEDFHMPATPGRVWAALQAAGRKDAA